MENISNLNENNINKCNGKCKNCNCKFKEKSEIIRQGVRKGILDAFFKISIVYTIFFICFIIICLVTLYIGFNIFFDNIANMINDISNNFTNNINSISNNFNESFKNIFQFKK